jgi:hypothetical protein
MATEMVPCATAAAVTRTLRLMTTVPVRELTTTRAGGSPGGRVACSVEKGHSSMHLVHRIARSLPPRAVIVTRPTDLDQLLLRPTVSVVWTRAR